ncbi:hypothetical protein CR513_45652, partial [Mucuna pruriens]
MARTKIDVHVGSLSMEFRDNLLQLNIFYAMRHPTEDHSLYSMDVIDELVEEYNQSSKVCIFGPGSVAFGHHSQQLGPGTRREIADSPSATQEINRVETFRPSRNQSIHLHA